EVCRMNSRWKILLLGVVLLALAGGAAFVVVPHQLLDVKLAPAAMSTKQALAPYPTGQIIDERFSCAPTEWRLAGAGMGQVKNRWQCEPRWTFFTLEND